VTAGLFVIQELPSGTENATDEEVTVQRFEWTADRVPTSSSGGARACPKSPWAIGGNLVRSRTDYPGSTAPSEQVMTAIYKEHRFEGVWSDKWNYPGYATDEQSRFEAMARRASLVEISYQEQVFRGLIFDWEFAYKGSFEIGYRFSFSVHFRAARAELSKERAEIRAVHVPDQEDAIEAVTREVERVLEAQDDMPRAAMSSDLAAVVDGLVNRLIDARNDAAATIATNPIGAVVRVGQEALAQWRTLGTRFRSVESQAASYVTALSDVRSDVTVGWQSVDTFFDCERWARAARYHGRRAQGDARAAAEVMERKAEPPAIRNYAAASGESLYAISQRFFGDPQAWRVIAHANGLIDPIIRSATILIIPSRLN